MLNLVVGAASADDLVVSVPGNVERVILQCGDQRYEEPVSRSGASGEARFPIRPGRECSVSFVQSSGTLTQIGSWECSDRGCTQRRLDVGEVVALPPGQVKIVNDAALPHPMLEMTCPSGFRQRAPVQDHVALFTGVPNEDCELFFKGGAPYRYRPMRWGTWACSVTSATLVCESRS